MCDIPIVVVWIEYFLPAQSETFPSKIRVSALSVSGTCGRMGALLAPALIEAAFRNSFSLSKLILDVAIWMGCFLSRIWIVEILEMKQDRLSMKLRSIWEYLWKETRGAPNSPEEFRVFLSILVSELSRCLKLCGRTSFQKNSVARFSKKYVFFCWCFFFDVFLWILRFLFRFRFPTHTFSIEVAVLIIAASVGVSLLSASQSGFPYSLDGWTPTPVDLSHFMGRWKIWLPHNLRFHDLIFIP